MIKYSNEEIITALLEFYHNTGKIPIKSEFTANNGYISNWVVINRFGSWNAGLKAAGLPINVKQNKNNKWNESNIIDYTKNYIANNKIYPNSSSEGAPSLTTIKRYFDGWHEVYSLAGYEKIEWDKESIIKAIIDFYNTFNKTPTSKDFRADTTIYPNSHVITKFFGSWNSAITEANLPISNKNGYGLLTKGLDGYTYRSRAEAYFCDTYLFNKYSYFIEPRYPAPYSALMYDWYIDDLDLYIELDGNLRPLTTSKKIHINKNLNRQCLFIDINKIYDSRYIKSII